MQAARLVPWALLLASGPRAPPALSAALAGAPPGEEEAGVEALLRAAYLLHAARGGSGGAPERLCAPAGPAPPARGVAPLRSAEGVGVVVVTARRFLGTRVRHINRTWGARFPSLVFASSEGAGAPGPGAQVWGLRAPPSFRALFDADGYESHVYKGHLGLQRLYRRRPRLPWYALVGDDAYLADAFLVEALRGVTPRPGAEAVCAGCLSRIPFDHQARTLRWMAEACGPGPACAERALRLLLPYANLTFLYGAAIFCSNAAVARLRPFLSSVLVEGYMEPYAERLADFVPGTDTVLGRCLRDLGVRLVDLPAAGYWGGDYLPGTVRNSEVLDAAFREGLRPLRLADARRPAVWHHLTEELQFDAADFWHAVLRGACAPGPGTPATEAP